MGFFIYGIYDNKKEKPECSTHSDCTPATCCHPKTCVPIAQKPNCDSAFCTMECSPGTLDCNQGYCACSRGKCSAVFEDTEN